MKNIFLLGLLLFVFNKYSIAQYFCAERHVSDSERLEGSYLNTQSNNQTQTSHKKKAGSVLEIPVVFHVVHHDSSAIGEEGNHSDFTILSTLDSLNDIYAHSSAVEFGNPFSGVDVGVRLVIAKQDPEGNPTTGIVRYTDNVCSVVYEGANPGVMRDSTQKKYHWPVQDYLNVYLVHILDVDGTQRSGVAIFYFGDGSDIPDYDGIVLSEKGFAHSSIFAHELGHYLSLFHTFASWNCENDNCELDGDQVCDTPPKSSATENGALACTPNDECASDEDDTDPRNPFRAVDLGGLGNQPDGIENYMDYVLGCHGAFTQGQKDRMRTYLQSSRSAILSSHALVEVITAFEGIDEQGFSLVPNPTNDILHITLKGNKAIQKVKIYNTAMRLVLESEALELSTAGLSNGLYIIQISTNEEVLVDTFVKY